MNDPSDIFAAAEEAPEEGAQQFEIEIDTDGIDVFDHSAEADAIAEAEEDDGITIPTPPTHLTAPINNPAMLEDPVGALREAAERSFTGKFDFGTVTVTPAERADFLRSALHDHELSFDIKLEGMDTSVRVAIPTETFTTSAASAAYAWGRSGFIDKDSDMQWLLAFQQMHAWYQVRDVNGIPTPWSDAFCDGVPKLSYMRDQLQNPENLDAIFSVGAARWRMMVEAMRIAEFKYKLCLEAWQDKSFFTPAATV